MKQKSIMQISYASLWYLKLLLLLSHISICTSLITVRLTHKHQFMGYIVHATEAVKYFKTERPKYTLSMQ